MAKPGSPSCPTDPCVIFVAEVVAQPHRLISETSYLQISVTADPCGESHRASKTLAKQTHFPRSSEQAGYRSDNPTLN